MLTRFRQGLGRLKGRLEQRVVTLGSGGKRRKDQAPISDADRQFMIEWLTGKADDEALVARARTGGGGRGLIERASAARPANPHLWAARAQWCLDEGDIAEALEHAQRAQAIGWRQPGVGLVLARAQAAAERREDALQTLAATLENARRLRAHAARLDSCELWRSLEPESIEPLLEAARAHAASGDLDTAIAHFENLRDRFGPRSDILLPLSSLYQDLLRIEDAMRGYLQAVEAEPDNADALCMAGVCARDLRDLATANRLLSRAFEIDPRSSFVQYNLGLLRLDQERMAEAATLVLGARASTRGAPWTAETIGAKLAEPVERDVAGAEWANARFKLEHDFEQLGYLRLKGRIGPVIDPVLAEYGVVLADPLLPATASPMVALDPAKYPMLARTYKAPLHAPDPEPPPGPLVNPDLAWQAIERRYYDARPSVVVIDDLLTPAALAAMRAHCLESTIWNGLNGGVLGAYMPDGFSGRLLLGIAAELRARMPRVLRDHLLQTMWGYKYDASFPGIGAHTDTAAVNVNFWTTPDEANLDPESGGLVIYTHDAPPDRSLRRFNNGGEEIEAFLASVDAKKVRIPYRANRAVIFDADLFHETDAFSFRKGYENRRVSVTMLYGTPPNNSRGSGTKCNAYT
jgi:tetratricopeptide (TPR) repeat protein